MQTRASMKKKEGYQLIKGNEVYATNAVHVH